MLCLDTKGNVTTTGKAGDLASDLNGARWLPNQRFLKARLTRRYSTRARYSDLRLRSQRIPSCLLHNHPSGDPQPSQEDIRATKQLIEAGNHYRDQGFGSCYHRRRDFCKSQGRRIYLKMRTGRRESPRFHNEQNCREKRRIPRRGA